MAFSISTLRELRDYLNRLQPSESTEQIALINSLLRAVNTGGSNLPLNGWLRDLSGQRAIRNRIDQLIVEFVRRKQSDLETQEIRPGQMPIVQYFILTHKEEVTAARQKGFDWQTIESAISYLLIGNTEEQAFLCSQFVGLVELMSQGVSYDLLSQLPRVAKEKLLSCSRGVTALLNIEYSLSTILKVHEDVLKVVADYAISFALFPAADQATLLEQTPSLLRNILQNGFDVQGQLRSGKSWSAIIDQHTTA